MKRANVCFAVLAAGCWMILTVLAPQVAGQESERSGGPESAARVLADDLVTKMRRHSEMHGQLVALEPLRPERFLDFDERRRQQLYDLLMGSLREEAAGSFAMMNQSRFATLSRTLEETGGADWFDRYLEIVQEAGAQISVSCRAGPARQGRFMLSCSADAVDPYRNLVSAQREFETDWLMKPVSPKSAIALIAAGVVERMQGSGGLLAVSIEDEELKTATTLANRFARDLRVEVDRKLRERTGVRPIEESRETPRYRVEGTLRRYEDKIMLHAELYVEDREYPETSFTEDLHWTDELYALSRAAVRPGEPGSECGTDEETGKRRLTDGTRLVDWVLLADDLLRSGAANHLELIVESQKHLANHCNWHRIAGILDAAVSAVENELAAVIADDARAGLERLLLVEAAAGQHLGLIRLRAQAHESLKEYRKGERAYTEWLELAPDTPPHPDRLDILRAQRRISTLLAAEDGEAALALDAHSRQLVRQGLDSEGFAGGEGTAEFDEVFRSALSDWQAAKGFPATGYLNVGQAQSLIAIGRARMAAEEGEKHLELNSEARMLVERGLASWRTGSGPVDGIFDAAFRTVLRAWQAEHGHAVTGFLTAGQSDTLIAVARSMREENRTDGTDLPTRQSILPGGPGDLVDFGNDGGRWANDGECDDPRFVGQGMAEALSVDEMGQDAADCRSLFERGQIQRHPLFGNPEDALEFGDDSGEWANDGECDDPRFVGDGMAETLLVNDMGRDAADCQSLFEGGRIRRHPLFGNPEDALDFGDDSSEWANDGECDDPRFVGDGMAETLLVKDIRRDAADCRHLFELGRIRMKSESEDLETSLEHSRSGTPGGPLDFGDDSSHWANDGECDDPRFVGDGMAETLLVEDMGRDAADCRHLFELGRIRMKSENEDLETSLEHSRSGTLGGPSDFGDDSSKWAYDGECDDPRFVGDGMADTLFVEDMGRDAADCRHLFELGRIRLRPLVGSDALIDQLVPVTEDTAETRRVELRVEFRFGSAKLTERAVAQLQALGEALVSEELREAALGIYGHTDATGPAEVNQKLSESRAQSVAVFLRERFNMDQSRFLEVRGYGESRLRPDLSPNAPAQRRVEIAIFHLDFGNDSSQWANDGECDDPRFVGDGMAETLLVEDMGRDAADCRHLFELGRIWLRPEY